MTTKRPFGAYNREVRRILLASSLWLGACAAQDPQLHLQLELAYLKPGVAVPEEEREVRRVLAQRGLRVVARRMEPSFIAIGAASRHDEHSAVRILTQRGVAFAEDGSQQDLFAPARVALLEHFGGNIGSYALVATARVPWGRDQGCVTLHRVLSDGRVVDSVLDVSLLGSRACVANLAPGRAGSIRATIAWPDLYALNTPTLEVALSLVEALPGRAPAERPLFKLVPKGDWLEQERDRLSTARLARAPFSRRHATGVARAALASLAGISKEQQVASYRESVLHVPPGSSEAEVVADTVAHIERGWMDPVPEAAAHQEERGPADPGGPSGPDEPLLEDDQMIVEPDAEPQR